MVFANLTFLFFFLPAVLCIYYAFPSRPVRNLILTLSSLLFYAWGEPIWVCLLIFSALWDYANGLWIERFRDRPQLAKLGLLSSLTVNLGLLGTFKYADFIVNSVNSLTGLEFKPPGILLPIGISFYTFQTISYTIDVYRGEVKAQRNLLNFMLFVVCFHQLVAGPIVRYAHVAREIEQRVFSSRDFTDGISRFCQGLFKKVFIANVAGEIAQNFLGKPPGEVSLLGEWFGLLMFTLQIYFDFSGYSDMAIGLGRMFGFHYRENFNYPYMSRSITDFWRRWHISLGTFFRDYVYIPLGGNRQNATRNILVVWGLTGLWHGASWNFVLWGLYFGIILLIEKGGLLNLLAKAPIFLQHAYALVLIVIGWDIFFFTDLDRLIESLRVLTGFSGQPLYDFEVLSAISNNIIWLTLAIIASTPLPLRIYQKVCELKQLKINQWIIPATNLALLGISTTLLVGKTYNPFIYFRF